jgi:hypothetical protein
MGKDYTNMDSALADRSSAIHEFSVYHVLFADDECAHLRFSECKLWLVLFTLHCPRSVGGIWAS